jgi:ABC-type Mn2+/Zn2+ transport system ATPase subunit
VAGAPALEVRGAVVVYEGDRRPALDGVTLRVPIGSRVALVGPNGAGKSTLLKAVAGLLPLAAGEIRVHGLPVGACHHRVAYLPQRSDLDWSFPVDVGRLVLTGRYVHVGWLRRPRAADRALADEMIDRLGLGPVAGRQLAQLSGGQQQRALLARALAQDADLLLLDEPLSAVDVETRAVVEELLADLARRGKTAVVATHDIAGREGDFDVALYLTDGRQTGAPSQQMAGHSH